ncbi:hypothetical protein CcCBS67573_g00243 [Chytriomyces confervae]|uniref:AB hydrolase-1 domain-containing protein n=1 Tax=Chytriomyces confervae TaxID=246404 RepID=A0A507FTU0_9FUNG|nr:hypothetical protein CcCBS67573_g00243 [Chytriomyces confervae]
MVNVQAVHSPKQNGFVTSDGASLYYEVHGASDSSATRRITLVSGVSQSCRMWGITLSYLLTDACVQVLVMDNRGVGDSSQSKDALQGLTMHQMGADLVAVLEHLRWTHHPTIPLSILGFSMGGMVALQAVNQLPAHACQSLVLVNTSAGGLWNLMPQFFSMLKAVGWIVVMMMKAALGWSTLKPGEDKIYVAERGIGKTKQTSSGRKAQMHAVSTHQLLPSDLYRIGMKTDVFVVSGLQDSMVRPSNSRYLAQHIPNSKTVTFENAGHAVFEQEHKLFHQFLQRQVLQYHLVQSD